MNSCEKLWILQCGLKTCVKIRLSLYKSCHHPLALALYTKQKESNKMFEKLEKHEKTAPGSLLLLLEKTPAVLCSYPRHRPDSIQWSGRSSWTGSQTLGSKRRLLELLEKWAAHGLLLPQPHQDIDCLRSCRNLQAKSSPCPPVQSDSKSRVKIWKASMQCGNGQRYVKMGKAC